MSPINTEIKVSYFNLSEIKKTISSLKDRVDHIVMILHWGGKVEGSYIPDFNQPNLAKKMINYGADLVIGHHSHTIQPYEIYKKKYIFYSLGNFCFSDFIFENKKYHMPKRRLISQVVNIRFNKKNYETKIKYFKNKEGYMEVMKYYSFFVKFRNFIINNIMKVYFLWKILIFIDMKIIPIYQFILRPDLTLTEKMRSLSLVKISKHFR